jgi:hypothetical protein
MIAATRQKPAKISAVAENGKSGQYKSIHKNIIFESSPNQVLTRTS